MQRTIILNYLKDAEAHIANGERHLAQQQELIERLKLQGRSTTDAESLLRYFEDCQALFVQERDRLLAILRDLHQELEKQSQIPPPS